MHWQQNEKARGMSLTRFAQGNHAKCGMLHAHNHPTHVPLSLLRVISILELPQTRRRAHISVHVRVGRIALLLLLLWRLHLLGTLDMRWRHVNVGISRRDVLCSLSRLGWSGMLRILHVRLLLLMVLGRCHMLVLLLLLICVLLMLMLMVVLLLLLLLLMIRRFVRGIGIKCLVCTVWRAGIMLHAGQGNIWQCARLRLRSEVRIGIGRLHLVLHRQVRRRLGLRGDVVRMKRLLDIRMDRHHGIPSRVIDAWIDQFAWPI